MKITLKFKSTIYTEETYPHSFEITYVRDMEIHIAEYKDEYKLSDIIFNNAHDFEDVITTKLHMIGCTTECLGFTSINNAKMSELTDLARLGIERI